MAEALATRFNGAIHISGTAQSPVGRCSPKFVTSVPERALLAHKTGSPLLAPGSSYTKSPSHSSATVTPISSVASSPSPVSPAVSARIGQSNSSGISSMQPKSGSLVSTPSSRPSVFSSIPIDEFTKEQAADEFDRLDEHDELAIMTFYNKCVTSKHLAVASAALVLGLEAVLTRSNGTRMVFDEMSKKECLVEYERLAQTSRDPLSVAKYAVRLGDHYIKNNMLSAATNAEIYYRIALNLTSKPGLGSFKREYEAKLVEAQREKARLSATSSSMPKPSIPPSTFSSSSGQPPFRAAPTPPITRGMPSTPPKPVPGRVLGSVPVPMSTSVPSARPAPQPPPQGSFSAPPSDTSVRHGVVQSSSSSSTPVRLAESPLASPTPRLPSLQEFVSDLQRRPGLPGIDFLTAEDIKNSQHLVLEIIRSAADYKAADYNRANESMKDLVSSFEEDNSVYSEDYYLREKSIRSGYYSMIANVLAKYQTNTDHAWLTLFYSAADCNSVGEHLGLPPKKQKRWNCDHFSYNRFAIQRRLGIDRKLWTPEYCKRICPYVDLKWNIGDAYEEAERKGNLKSQQPGLKASSSAAEDEAAFRERMGLYHYRMMGTNSIKYGGYSNM